MDWYVAHGGLQSGPFSVEKLARRGLRPDTLVWKAGMTEWVRADAVAELRPMLSAAPASPVPPGTPPPYPPGMAPPPNYPGQPVGYYGPAVPLQSANSTRIAAGICGILLGTFGVHRFILGDITGGLLRILISLVTCGLGHGIGIIEGIIYLTKTDAEFYQTYMVEKKAWF